MADTSLSQTITVAGVRQEILRIKDLPLKVLGDRSFNQDKCSMFSVVCCLLIFKNLMTPLTSPPKTVHTRHSVAGAKARYHACDRRS
jgi:hypothetical protein